jgi:3-(methylthio)propanoyl-CoA dehydrogenase
MANFLTDNEDLQYYLGKGVDWQTVVAWTELGLARQGSKGGLPADGEGFADLAEAMAFYRDTTSMVGELVADEIAPYTAQIDREGIRFAKGEATFPPRLEGITRKLAELGLHGLLLPRELGGMNAPVLLYFFNAELIARGDVSVMTHYGFHGGMAMAMLILSQFEGTTELDPATGKILRTRFPEEIREIIEGRAWGSMDITEPDAGSDMAALRATGVLGADGQWRVSGQKIFITSGHGKYHFVIARTGPGEGLAGLSMFLVPSYQDLPGGGRKWLATLDRVEEKIGHHASATVAITFENTPAHLLGKPGEGFRFMLEIMNHARLGVGFESIGLLEAAYRLARGYAAERRSMGKTIDRHEMIADYLDEMELDLVALRALAVHAAYHEEVGHKQELYGRFTEAGRTDPEGLAREARAHRAAARRATPLLKYLAAEKAVEGARRCLQIHGGNGYMQEFGAEKLLRDSLVMPIYEGTSQIQSLMAMKDTLGAITRSPQDFFKRIASTRLRAMTAKSGLARRVARLQLKSLGAQRHLITRTFAAKARGLRGQPFGQWSKTLFGQWNPKTDFTLAMLHAERLTRLLADELIAEVLLEQAEKHPERAPLLERFLERAEPRASFLYEEITRTGERLLAKLDGLKQAAPVSDRGRSAAAPTAEPVASEPRVEAAE